MQGNQKKGIGDLFTLGGVKPGKWYAAIFISILGTLLEAFPYVSIYFVIQNVLSGAANGEGIQTTTVFSWGILTLLALLLSILCTALGGYGAHKSAFELIYRLRRRVLSQLGALPMGFFSTHSTGEIQKQMESEMNKIEQKVSHSIPNMIGAAPLLFGLLASMFLLNVWLALAVLAVLVLAFVIQGLVYGSKDSQQMAVDTSKKQGDMNRWFNEYLRGISVVKIFGGGQKFQKLNESILAYRDHMLDFTKRVAVPFSLFKLLTLSVLTFVLPVATLLIALYGGELKLVLTILMFLIVTPCLYSPLMELMRFSVELQEANVAAAQIDQLLKTEPLHERSHPEIPTSFEVCFEGVSFSYQSASDPMRQWALREVSFTAPVGGVTALVGPSGGGKSTAGQLLCRFWDVTEGSIRIGGVNIQDIALATLMDCIAFVFQDTFLFSASVYENITMNRTISREKVEAAAKAAMCHNFIVALPDGYNTRLGDGGHHLSGGEAQRIAIARAILKDAPIVVLDEATAFTDADNETLIQQALHRLLAGKTVFMIAHRLATIQTADQILVMNEGHVVQRGTHASLVAQQGIYRKLWDIQNEVAGWQLQLHPAMEGGG